MDSWFSSVSHRKASDCISSETVRGKYIKIRLKFKDSSDLVFRDIRLVGTLLGSHKYLQETIDLCAKYGIKVNANLDLAQVADASLPYLQSTLLTYKLEDLDELVSEAQSSKKKGKTVVTFSEN